MPTADAYRKAYKALNKEQKKAVDTIYGPVMVIAGPGTGKTQILAVRIANILQSSKGAQPDEILALTFTESATASLQMRLAGLIGASAYRVRIKTFHGFARYVIEKRPDLFARVADGTQLTDVSGIALMERLLDAHPYTKIKKPKNPYRNSKDLLGFMSELKSENYTPEKYLEELTSILKSHLESEDRFHVKGKYEGKEKGESIKIREKFEKHIEVAHLFNSYQNALEKERSYDYQDLISEAVRGLESDEGLRFDVAEECQFVLADEHQDANPAQNRLLELVTDFDGAPNLFIVGDEKQAIYRFQGASLQSFFYFKEKYPEASVICLTQNYRSTDEILKAAHALIAPSPIPDPELRKELESVTGKGVSIRVASRGTPREEHMAIVSYIQELRKKRVQYEDIAILTRKNADVLALGSLLQSVGIPEDHASADLDALTHPAVQVFISLIRYCADPNRDNDLARALFIPGFPIDPLSRMKILAHEREGRRLGEVIDEHGTTGTKEWLSNVRNIATEIGTTPAVVWLGRLASESGFLAGILGQSESEEAYEAYVGFMDEMALMTKTNPRVTGLDVPKHLALIEDHELSITRARTKRKGVQVMTAHKAKGMEFEYVIIAHATDERWTRGRSAQFSLLIEKEEDEHEIRRLFYVALTRAKQELLITYAGETEEARTQTPLRFLADIREHLQEDSEVNAPLQIAKHTIQPIFDIEFLKERLLSQGFSPTGYNNFVASPWQYFFRTLLRIPDAPASPMLFGTAVHVGLKAYADVVKACSQTGEGKASTETAVTAFVKELSKLPIAHTQREALMSLGKDTLEAYLAEKAEGFIHLREAEMSVRIPLSIPGVGEIILSGKLDRLDVLPNGSVVVIDYKTGKSKTENEIKGLTQNGNSDYYRQLVFYKLLLEKDGRYKMTHGALHFVEPDQTGKIVTREFSITDEEVRELEAQIILAAKHISDGSAFKDLVCDPEVCDYCDLVALLAGNK